MVKKKTFKILGDTIIKNEYILKAKKNIPKNRHIPTKGNKIIRSLYDSGWINVQKLSSNLIKTKSYGYIDYFKNLPMSQAPTTNYNISPPYYDEYPLSLVYSFNQKINIPTYLIPFIKAQIMVKAPDDVKIKGINIYNSSKYDVNYYEIKGDNNLIYKGTNPPGLSSFNKIWQWQLDKNEIQQNYLSKWFIGNVSGGGYNGESIEYRDTYIMELSAYYEISKPDNNAPDFDYKRFICSAIDNITGNFFTGTGTYIEVTWTETSPNVWESNTAVTKNIIKTAPLFTDTTKITIQGGSKFVNGSFQLFTPSTTFYFIGTRGADSNPYIVMTNITMDVAQLTQIIDGYTAPQKAWKLWYSPNRATLLKFSTSTQLLRDLPQNISYENKVLPYTKITVKANPNGYPEAIADKPKYSQGYQVDSWAIINKDSNNVSINNNLSKVPVNYRYLLEGSIQMMAPANYDIRNDTSLAPYGEVSGVNEEYTQVPNPIYPEDISYERVSENRDPKIMPMFIASPKVCQIRLKLTLVNPMHTSILETYNV
ncbi:MAG TPA: hypothetical protein ENI61_00675 [Ignavibacteria bacterium]|nr:hypothetical protein [Ignavibacteria bacterium]